MTPLAENIRICRAIRNWSQTKLAVEAKLSPTTICEMESGLRKRVWGETLDRIAEAFGVATEELEQKDFWRGYGFGIRNTGVAENDEWAKETLAGDTPRKETLEGTCG